MRKINPEYVERASSITNHCPYFKLLSMKILELEVGRSLLEIDLQEKHLQPFGIVHGGVFASIIDAASFWAAYTEVGDDAGMTTVDLKLNYLAPAEAGKLIARGRCIKFGKTLALAEAKVTNERGKLLAHGTSTLMVIAGLDMKSPSPHPSKFIEDR